MKIRTKAKGFTLLELMTVMAIIGILATFSYASYTSQLKKSRRAEAAIALESLAQGQERFFARYRTYTSVVVGADACGGAACGLGQSSNETQNGYYQLAANGNATSYSLSATASEVQVEDSDCRTFRIDNVGSKSSTSATGEDTSNTCW